MPKQKTEEMVKTSLYLPDAMLVELDEVAAKTGWQSRSNVLVQLWRQGKLYEFLSRGLTVAANER